MNCRLYFRHIYRYRAVQMRPRFEEIMNEKDLVKSSRLLAAIKQELFNTQHYQPLYGNIQRFHFSLHYYTNLNVYPIVFGKFLAPYSAGGCAYQREVNLPDWILDYWHPLEKAQYPEFFARREQRKKEYIAWWEKKYGKPNPEDLAH